MITTANENLLNGQIQQNVLSAFLNMLNEEQKNTLSEELLIEFNQDNIKIGDFSPIEILKTMDVNQAIAILINVIDKLQKAEKFELEDEQFVVFLQLFKK